MNNSLIMEDEHLIAGAEGHPGFIHPHINTNYATLNMGRSNDPYDNIKICESMRDEQIEKLMNVCKEELDKRRKKEYNKQMNNSLKSFAHNLSSLRFTLPENDLAKKNIEIEISRIKNEMLALAELYK